MRYTTHVLNVLIISTILFITGCAVNGTITDFNMVRTKVKSLHLEKHDRLTVLDGSGIRELKLGEVRSIRIQPDENKTYNKKLFYLAVISFDNGTTTGTFDNSKKKAYIAVDNYLYGKANKGEYRILLGNVSKIEIHGR